MIVGPLVMTQVFAAFTVDQAPVYFPGAHFLLAAVLASAAFLPLMTAIRRLEPTARRSETGQARADEPIV
jgi:DHA1 family tetracycline resistance protein-like MFS transporter